MKKSNQISHMEEGSEAQLQKILRDHDLSLPKHQGLFNELLEWKNHWAVWGLFMAESKWNI